MRGHTTAHRRRRDSARRRNGGAKEWGMEERRSGGAMEEQNGCNTSTLHLSVAVGGSPKNGYGFEPHVGDEFLHKTVDSRTHFRFRSLNRSIVGDSLMHPDELH
jgi:hypothetical protein